MKSKLMDLLKHLKTLFDAWKIWIYVIGALSAVGVGGYAVMGEPEQITEALPIPAMVAPEYALKGHSHPQTAHSHGIKQAIKEHDPQGLGH